MKSTLKIASGAGVLLLGLVLGAMPSSAASLSAASSGASSSNKPSTSASAASAKIQDQGFREIVTATNDPDNNELKVYDENLNLLESVSTGGKGTGAGLGSQGGIVYSGGRLLVVNAGDDTVSSFKFNNSGVPQLVDTVNSEGDMPVSVDIHGNVAYVVNAGDNKIAGFTIASNGDLTYIEDSDASLSGTAPAQISFAPSGADLIVTEKDSNQIEVFPLDSNNKPEDSVVTPSSGDTPFGFEVKGDRVIVSEAFGGTASALSTYKLNSDGSLSIISGSVHAPDQAAACWVATSRDGKYAYMTNTGSDTVSSYTHNTNGEIQLLDATAASTGAAPADMTKTDTKLYVLTSEDLEQFDMSNDGSLDSAGDSASIAGAYGLVTVHR